MDRALRHPKFLVSIFVKEIKEEIETMFAMNFARNHEKKLDLEHQTLGRQFICPSEPAYYIQD